MENFDFAQIYASRVQANGRPYANNSKEITKIIHTLNGVDLNNCNAVLAALKAANPNVKNKTLGDKVSSLATFISLLNEEQLRVLNITDKEKLTNCRDPQLPRGTYWLLKDNLRASYDEQRRSGQLEEVPDVTIEQVKEFGMKHVKICQDMLVFVDPDVDTIMKFQLSFIVALYCNMPDLRSAPHDLQLEAWSSTQNYVIDAAFINKVFIVYNKHKNLNGTIVHDISKGDMLYDLVHKMIYITKRNGKNFLFYDYVKNAPYTVEQFRKLVREAFDEVNLGVRLLRYFDETERLSDIADARELEIASRKRGHSLIEAFNYIKNLKRSRVE